MVVRLQDSTKKKREYLPPFMIASYFYGDEKGNIVNIIWWLSFLSNAAVYVEFVSTIINMQYKGYCLNMAQHLRLSVARKIKFLIFKLIWGILFHNWNVNGSILYDQNIGFICYCISLSNRIWIIKFIANMIYS